MTTTLSNIISDVRTVIDDISIDDDILDSSDSELDTIIKSKIPEAADYIHLNADINLLRGDNVTQLTISKYNASRPNLLRFISAIGSDWSRSVTSLIPNGTPEYSLALDPYVGASKERPAALSDITPSGRTITLVPTTDDKVYYVHFIPHSAITNNSISIDSNLYHAFINYLGALTLLVLNDSRGENLLTHARNEIGEDTSVPNSQQQ